MDREKLGLYREKIDGLDRQIAALIVERAETAREIGRVKGSAPVYDPGREKQVIDRVVGECPGLDREAVARIYREVISLCRGVQYRPKAAFLGPEGSYSHEAVLAAFGGSVDLLPCASFPEILAMVDKGSADWGLLPAENSLEGTVLPTMDAFASAAADISIHSEVAIPVDHMLAAEAGALEEISEVLSHPQALGQCRDWLRKNLPLAEQVPAGSTSAAAASCVGRPGRAAVCSALAAAGSGLRVLAEKIQDRGRNSTRFWVVGRGTPKRGELNKTSFLFNVEHKPGRLFYALEPLYENGLNLTHIQSRPLTGSPFEYYFFIDVDGFIEDEPVKKALSAMAERTAFLRVLGSYPCL
ncbi:MAG: prephenate dehydratase [Synergistaceae bacterium]|nr:prephenate dehydratase [Synergistaceae bacterium]